MSEAHDKVNANSSIRICVMYRAKRKEADIFSVNIKAISHFGQCATGCKCSQNVKIHKTSHFARNALERFAKYGTRDKYNSEPRVKVD